MHRDLKREFVSDPYLPGGFNALFAKILQLSAQDHWIDWQICTGLLYRQELNLGGMSRVALRLSRKTAQRKWRNGPQECERIIHWDAQLGGLARIRFARGAMKLFGQEFADQRSGFAIPCQMCELGDPSYGHVTRKLDKEAGGMRGELWRIEFSFALDSKLAFFSPPERPRFMKIIDFFSERSECTTVCLLEDCILTFNKFRLCGHRAN